ncbi:hypothetical protein LSAT2_025211 [Lamellibrachia satsuma]|nr:hypothetical protein LSAT2_025211 [Lamellibrachia satsuma]
MKNYTCAVATLLLLLFTAVSTTEGASTELCVCIERCRWDDIKCQGDNWKLFSLRFSEPEYVIAALLLLFSTVTSAVPVGRRSYDEKPCPCVDDCRQTMRTCMEDNTSMVDSLKLHMPEKCYEFINRCLENCLQQK